MADRNAIDCPRAKTWMTPCVARDGANAVADDGVCVGCGAKPDDLLADLAERHEPARRYLESRHQSHGPGQGKTQHRVADRLASMVAAYVDEKGPTPLAYQTPAEALEAAARALHEHDREVAAQHDDDWKGWDDLTEDERASYNSAIGDVLAAAAPHLITKGRRQAADEIRRRGAASPNPRAEEAAAWAARIAEGTDG